jgi:hypothetical protein
MTDTMTDIFGMPCFEAKEGHSFPYLLSCSSERKKTERQDPWECM